MHINIYMKIYTIATLIFIVIYFILILFGLNGFYNKKNRFHGQERIMSHDWYKSYGSIKIQFKNIISEIDKKFIIFNLTKELNNKKSILRINKRDNLLDYYYEDISTNDIINNCVLTIRDKINEIDVNKITVKKNKSFTIIFNKNIIYFTAQHAILDLIKSSNLFLGIISTDSIKFTGFKKNYIPIIDDVRLLWNLPNLLDMPNKRNFKHYHDYNESSVDKYPYFIEKEYSVSKFKESKKKLETSFQAVQSGYIMQSIFNVSSQDKLNLCITVGFDSNTHFNNFGCILFEVKRERLLDNYIKQIEKKINKYKNNAVSSYILNNVWDLHSKTNVTDVLVTSLPITSKQIKTFDNNYITNAYVNFVYCSSPIFVIAVSTEDTLSMNYNVRTGDIDKSKLIEQ